MKETKKHLKIIAILVLLQFLLDMLYFYLYPNVNPIRATFIGLSALVILFIPFITKLVGMKPYIAFMPIYSSALFGALLVQAGVVASKSTESGIAHVLILIITYGLIVFIQNSKQK